MTDIAQNPPPPVRIDVDVHNERLFVRVNGELVAVRDQKTGSVVWHDLGGRLTEADKNVIRIQVFGKIPLAPRPQEPKNRAERRRRAHATKKGRP